MTRITFMTAALAIAGAALGSAPAPARSSSIAIGVPRAPAQPGTHPGRPGGHHPGRPGGHGGHWNGGWGLGYWGYSSDGDHYADTIPSPDQFGFFANGGQVSQETGAPVYNYDRGYPYDWYRGAQRPAAGGAPTASLRCESVNVRDERLGGRVPVRVCRTD